MAGRRFVFLSLTDEVGSNIGNAKLAGLSTGLNLSADGSQYNAALTIFFVSYAGFEPLTNVLLKYFRPSRFLPVTMILWGICMTTVSATSEAGRSEPQVLMIHCSRWA